MVGENRLPVRIGLAVDEGARNVLVDAEPKYARALVGVVVVLVSWICEWDEPGLPGDEEEDEHLNESKLCSVFSTEKEKEGRGETQ